MTSGITIGLGGILHSLISFYIWIVIIAVILSWVRPNPNNPMVQVFYRITEPAFMYIRRYIPSVFNGVDLSPVILIIGLEVVDVILINIINSLANF
jgi:YggT family protein